MQEVYDFLKKCKTYYLATCENGQARVRPFGTVDIFDGTLRIQTGASKPVSHQLKENPKGEICAFDAESGTWLRVAATFVEDPRIEAQEHMLDTHPNLRKNYAPGDGNTIVYYLKDAEATFSSFTAPSRTVKF